MAKRYVFAFVWSLANGRRAPVALCDKCDERDISPHEISQNGKLNHFRQLYEMIFGYVVGRVGLVGGKESLLVIQPKSPEAIEHPESSSSAMEQIRFVY